MVTSQAATTIRWFGEDGCSVVETAGGKGASLSRMTAAALAVPPGFVVCAEAFARFLDANAARGRLLSLLDGLDVERPSALNEAAERVQRLIRDLPLPAEIEATIVAAYRRLTDGTDVPVAVRSSAIAEDSAAASFAGQQETFLNVV